MSQLEEPVLVASVHDVRPFAMLLRSLSFSSQAAISVSEAGLTVSVEESRVLVARSYIPVSLFDEFTYRPAPQDRPPSQDPNTEEESSATFEIPLDMFLECLNIFGTATASFSQYSLDDRKKKRLKPETDDEDEGRGRSKGKRGTVPKGNSTIDQYFLSGGLKKTGMRMSYAGPGYPLTLILTEDATGPVTTCEIETMENEARMELPFDDSQKLIRIILRSSWLRDALSELDPSCDKLTFISTPPSQALPIDPEGPQKVADKPTLRLSAEGTFGSTQVDYPNDRTVLETFECTRDVKFTYRVAHIICAMKALQTSLKTSLRIDETGLLSLQFMMSSAEAFTEFRCMALQEDL